MSRFGTLPLREGVSSTFLLLPLKDMIIFVSNKNFLLAIMRKGICLSVWDKARRESEGRYHALHTLGVGEREGGEVWSTMGEGWNRYLYPLKFVVRDAGKDLPGR